MKLLKKIILIVCFSFIFPFAKFQNFNLKNSHLLNNINEDSKMSPQTNAVNLIGYNFQLHLGTHFNYELSDYFGITGNLGTTVKISHVFTTDYRGLVDNLIISFSFFSDPIILFLELGKIPLSLGNTFSENTIFINPYKFYGNRKNEGMWGGSIELGFLGGMLFFKLFDHPFYDLEKQSGNNWKELSNPKIKDNLIGLLISLYWGDLNFKLLGTIETKDSPHQYHAVSINYKIPYQEKINIFLDLNIANDLDSYQIEKSPPPQNRHTLNKIEKDKLDLDTVFVGVNYKIIDEVEWQPTFLYRHQAFSPNEHQAFFNTLRDDDYFYISASKIAYLDYQFSKYYLLNSFNFIELGFDGSFFITHLFNLTDLSSRLLFAINFVINDYWSFSLTLFQNIPGFRQSEFGDGYLLNGITFTLSTTWGITYKE